MPVRRFAVLVVLSIVVCAFGGGVWGQEVGKSTPAQQVENLINKLRDQDVQVRVRAVKALADMKDPVAVKGLIMATRDKDVLVSKGAVAVLTKMNPSTVVKAVLDNMPQEEPIGIEEEDDPLLVYLRGMKQSRIVDSLVVGLSHKNEMAASAAAELLCKMKNMPRVRLALVEAYLRSPSYGVREQAKFGLLETGGGRDGQDKMLPLKYPDVADVLSKTVVSETDPKVRARAIQSLEYRPRPENFVPLLEALKAPQEDVREAAISALHELYCDQMSKQFKAALKHPDARVRKGIASIFSNKARWGDTKSEAARALVASLRDEDVAVRVEALSALRKCPYPQAAGALIEMLKNMDKRTAYTTALILGHIGDRRATQPLVKALQRYKDDPRVYIEVLGAIGDPAAEDALIQIAKGWGEGCKEAFLALGRLGGKKSVDLLLETLALDEPPIHRSELIGVLARLDDPRARRFVVDELKKNPKWRYWTAIRDLSVKLTDEEVDYFDKRLRSPDITQGEAQNNLRLFAKTNTPRSRRAMVRALGSANDVVSKAAKDVLGLYRNRDIVPFLRRALKDKNPKLRLAALEKLNHWIDTPAVPALIDALGDKDPKIREKVQGTLVFFTKERTSTDRADWKRWWQRNRHSFFDVDTIVAAIRANPDGNHMMRVLKLLQMEDAKSARGVVGLFELKGNRFGLRVDLLPYRLAKSGHPRTFAALKDALKHKNPRVRDRAVKTLTMLRDPRAVPLIIDMLKDKDAGVRRMAAFGLSGIFQIGFDEALDFGEDQPTWRMWWKNHKESFVFPPL